MNTSRGPDTHHMLRQEGSCVYMEHSTREDASTRRVYRYDLHNMERSKYQRKAKIENESLRVVSPASSIHATFRHAEWQFLASSIWSASDDAFLQGLFSIWRFSGEPFTEVQALVYVVHRGSRHSPFPRQDACGLFLGSQPTPGSFSLLRPFDARSLKFFDL